MVTRSCGGRSRSAVTASRRTRPTASVSAHCSAGSTAVRSVRRESTSATESMRSASAYCRARTRVNESGPAHPAPPARLVQSAPMRHVTLQHATTGHLALLRPGASHRAQRQRGVRRQAATGSPYAHRIHRRPARPDRGRSRGRQDDAGALPRGEHRYRLRAHPVHPRPAARRHRGHDRVEQRDAPVRVQAGRHHAPVHPGGRDQPRLAAHPVEPAGGDAGGLGDGRRHHLPAARSVLRDRHPEPGDLHRRVPPARGRTRPVRHLPVDRLSAQRRRGAHPGPVRLRSAARVAAGGAARRT